PVREEDGGPERLRPGGDVGGGPRRGDGRRRERAAAGRPRSRSGRGRGGRIERNLEVLEELVPVLRPFRREVRREVRELRSKESRADLRRTNVDALHHPRVDTGWSDVGLDLDRRVAAEGGLRRRPVVP